MWKGYDVSKGKDANAFKAYLRSRNIYFEPSENGNRIHFEVKDPDKYVDIWIESYNNSSLKDKRVRLQGSKEIKDAFNIFSTEDFVEWHDKGFRIDDNFDAKIKKIYKIFRENGFDEDDDVDYCYENLSDKDKYRVSYIIESDLNYIRDSKKVSDGVNDRTLAQISSIKKRLQSLANEIYDLPIYMGEFRAIEDEIATNLDNVEDLLSEVYEMIENL